MTSRREEKIVPQQHLLMRRDTEQMCGIRVCQSTGQDLATARHMISDTVTSHAMRPEQIANPNGNERFEFRCWPESVAELRDKIDALFSFQGVQERVDTYLLNSKNKSLSPKFRGSESFDVKRRLYKKYPLEYWSVDFRAAFPISGEKSRRLAKLFPDAGFTGDEVITRGDIISSLSRELSLHRVAKLRRLYAFKTCQAETTRAIINQKPYETIAFECEDAGLLRHVIYQTGAHGYQNVNYGEKLQSNEIQH